jgi:large conductance mechanosensitive channel
MATRKSAPAKKKTTLSEPSAAAVTAASTSAARSAKSARVSADRAEESKTNVERLEKKAEKIVGKLGVHKQIHGFVDFLREQSVVGLAIGLVLGTQAKVLVDQLIASFINPLVGLLLPGKGTLLEKTFTVHLNGKAAAFGWGAFVISLLTFVVVAAVVYFVFKGLKLDKLDKKKE